MKTRSSASLGGGAVIIRSPPAPSSGRDGNSAALCLGELAQDHSTLHQREMVDKKDAIEVLDLMLQAGGEEPLGVHLADLVLVVEIAQTDRGRPAAVGIMRREAGGEEPLGVHLADLVLVVEIAQTDRGRPADVGIMLRQ